MQSIALSLGGGKRIARDAAVAPARLGVAAAPVIARDEFALIGAAFNDHVAVGQVEAAKEPAGAFFGTELDGRAAKVELTGLDGHIARERHIADSAACIRRVRIADLQRRLDAHGFSVRILIECQRKVRGPTDKATARVGALNRKRREIDRRFDDDLLVGSKSDQTARAVAAARRFNARPRRERISRHARKLFDRQRATFDRLGKQAGIAFARGDRYRELLVRILTNVSRLNGHVARDLAKQR